MPLARYAVGKASWKFVVGRTKLCRAEPAAASRPDVELLVQLVDACGGRDLDQEAPKILKCSEEPTDYHDPSLPAAGDAGSRAHWAD